MQNITIDINFIYHDEKQKLLDLLKTSYHRKLNAYQGFLSRADLAPLNDTLRKGLKEISDYADIIEKTPHAECLELYNTLSVMLNKIISPSK